MYQHNSTYTSVCRRDVLTAHAHTETASLIGWHRERSRARAAPRGSFVQSESTDSGGSFEASESDECWDTDTDKVKAQATFGGHVVLVDELPGSIGVARETADCGPGTTRSAYTADSHKDQCEVSRGGCKLGPTDVSGLCANNMSTIFSRLATDLPSRSAPPADLHTGVSDDISGKCRVSDEDCVSHAMDDTPPCVSQAMDDTPPCVSHAMDDTPPCVSQAMDDTPPCAECEAGSHDMVVPSCLYLGHNSDHHSDQPSARLPLVLESFRRLTRSVSDSGGSAGSCDKASLSCSRSSGDVRLSTLSLAMGISVSSLDSLEESCLAESAGSLHTAPATLARRAATHEGPPHGQVCAADQRGQAAHEGPPHGQVCAADQRVQVAHEGPPHGQVCAADQAAHETCSSCVHALACSSDSSGLGQPTGELRLAGQEAQRRLSAGTTDDTSSCLADCDCTPARMAGRARRKRDFHFWEQHLATGVEEGCDPSIFELVQCLHGSCLEDRSCRLGPSCPRVGGDVDKLAPADVDQGEQTPCQVSDTQASHGEHSQAGHGEHSQAGHGEHSQAGHGEHSQAGHGEHSQAGHGEHSHTQRHGEHSHTQRHGESENTGQDTQAGLLTTPRSRVGVCPSAGHSSHTHGDISRCYLSTSHNLPHVSSSQSPGESTAARPASACRPHLANSEPVSSDSFGSTSLVKSGASQLDQPGTSNHKDCADTGCLKNLGEALRHLSSPTRGVTALFGPTRGVTALFGPTRGVAALFGSNRCQYDVQLAAREYSQRSADKPGAGSAFRHKFASTKSSSFDSSCLYVGTPHLKNSPSVPVLLSSSSPLSSSSARTVAGRVRSFSLDSPRVSGGPSSRVTVGPSSRVTVGPSSRVTVGPSSRVTVGPSSRVTGGPTSQEPTLGSRTGSSEAALSGQHAGEDDLSGELAGEDDLSGEYDDADLLAQNWFDAQKSERNRVSYDGSDGRAPKKAQQFGLSLHDIKNNTGRIVPLPVEESLEFLKAVGGDEVEGLFRRCARVSTMREVQERYDDGERIDFHAYNDPHLAAAILKKFLRELQEPIMTYDLFEPITRLHYLETSKQLSEVQRILQDELPEDNYIILKYVFQFLRQVASKSEMNHMTAENIATVFGPNIAWPKGQANLAAVEQAVKFCLILVQHFDDVFLR